MIILDLPYSRLPELDEMVRQGVTSFKMFMAYLGAIWAGPGDMSVAMGFKGNSNPPDVQANL